MCLIHSNMQHAVLVVRAYCWLMLSLLSSSTPRSLSAELLSSHPSPSLYLCLTLHHPRCRTQYLPLLNFIPLVITQRSNLSESLCKASSLSGESTTSLILDLLRMHSTAASRSLIDMLNRIGPRIEPWGILLSDWLPARYSTVHYKLLSSAIQLVQCPVYLIPVHLTIGQFVQKDTVHEKLLHPFFNHVHA